MSDEIPYTEYLSLRLSPDFRKATESPFLVQAGDGSIKENVLVKWLRQDYLYIYMGYIKVSLQASSEKSALYPTTIPASVCLHATAPAQALDAAPFASGLLSRLPINPSPNGPRSTSRSRAIRDAVPLLTFSLSNALAESNFFKETAEEHGLSLFDTHQELPWLEDGAGRLLGPYESVTRSYVDFLWAIGSGGTIEEGLVLLWTMEKAYLSAWQYAKKHTAKNTPTTEKEKALAKFINNWTSDDFVKFVNECERVVNQLDLDPESELGKRCEEVGTRVQACSDSVGVHKDTLARAEILARRLNARRAA